MIFSQPIGIKAAASTRRPRSGAKDRAAVRVRLIRPSIGQTGGVLLSRGGSHSIIGELSLAGVAKLAYARDLGSRGANPCRFESCRPHGRRTRNDEDGTTAARAANKGVRTGSLTLIPTPLESSPSRGQSRLGVPDSGGGVFCMRAQKHERAGAQRVT